MLTLRRFLCFRARHSASETWIFDFREIQRNLIGGNKIWGIPHVLDWSTHDLYFANKTDIYTHIYISSTKNEEKESLPIISPHIKISEQIFAQSQLIFRRYFTYHLDIPHFLLIYHTNVSSNCLSKPRNRQYTPFRIERRKPWHTRKGPSQNVKIHPLCCLLQRSKIAYIRTFIDSEYVVLGNILCVEGQ